MAKLDYAALSNEVRYTLISVFKSTPGALGDNRAEAISEAQAFFDSLESRGVVLRGVYDVAGFRADADYMFWIHGLSIEELQAAYKDFRRTTAVGRASEPVWSVFGLNRPAEFNKSHIPAFVAGEPPQDYICVYPFVRSYEWYLLPADERRAILVNHGMAGREFPDVRANTVESFALGDYEWLLIFEAEKMDRIVQLMHHLRGTEARRHVRVEIPFYSGPRVELDKLIAALP